MLWAMLFAGFILAGGPLISVLNAMSSGVIIRKGHGAVRIERATDPERFAKLLRIRMATMIPGLILIGVFVALLVPGIIGLATGG